MKEKITVAIQYQIRQEKIKNIKGEIEDSVIDRYLEADIIDAVVKHDSNNTRGASIVLPSNTRGAKPSQNPSNKELMKRFEINFIKYRIDGSEDWLDIEK